MAIDFDFEHGSILSSIVDDIVPDHVRANYPGLLRAVKVYAEYLEHINNSGHLLNEIDAQRDIDRVEELLLDQLAKEIGAPIPRRFEADKRLLYKRVTEFYRSRGTPASIEAFFRILFDDEVEIYFPKEDMFIPSDGRWFDRTDEIVSNSTSYVPSNIFTISSTTDEVSGTDDNGITLKFDNPVVFVNDTRVTAFTPYLEVNTSTNVLDYSIVFDSDLSSGDVVKIYRNGSFTTNDSFVNDGKKLQDSFFYQKFSYVLRTGANIDSWKNAFNRLVHPAGFIFFGEILLFLDNLGQNIPLIQPGFQVSGLPFPIVISDVDATVSFVKTKTIDSVVETASYIEVTFKHQNQLNQGVQNQFWEQLKFEYTDQLSNIGHYTFEDAINKAINDNINSYIEIT
jgi:hypothetical protein